MRLLLLACICFLALAAASHASEGPPPLLLPKTYTSPSGEYSLFINPSEQHGIGAGSYTLKRRAETLWTRDLPYSLWEAALTDDGRTAGYAYSHGFQGWGAQAGFGDLIVALIGADGKEISRETTERKTPGGFWSCPPVREPSPRGFFLHPTLDRFVVRLTADPATFGSHNEKWRCYALADGKPSGEISVSNPGPEYKQGVTLWYMGVAANAIPATELTLITWSRTDWRPNFASDEGVRLSLVDKDAKEVWSREWTTEFSGIQYFIPWQLAESDITPASRFPRSGFVYRSRSRQAAITFSATKGLNGEWIVEETGAVPEAVNVGRYPDPAVAAAPAPSPSAPAARLESLGTISLGASGAPASLDIGEFTFDHRGRIGFIPYKSSDATEITLIDPAAPDPVRDALRVPVDFPKGDSFSQPQLAWIGGDRWVIVRGSHDDQVPTSGWIVDVAARSTTPIQNFDAPKPNLGHGAISGGENGFAILGDYKSGQFVRYNSTGERLWAAPSDVTTQDAAIRPDGSVGLLIGIKNCILEYDRTGKRTDTIKLANAFTNSPQYVAGLEPDENDGWIVHDFAGNPPVVRLTADHTQKSSFTPHYPDGRTFRLRGDVRRAPGGRLWTSDRASLLRLADDGTVDLIIGPKPDSDSLDEIRAVTVDHTGRIYAVNGHTAAVHVFDSTGKQMRILRPDPTDFPTDCGIGSITVAADGEVFCRPSAIGMGESRYLKFDAAGKREGFQSSLSGEVCDEWFFRPDSRERVVLGYERAFLYDVGGNRTRTLERRADSLWLANPFDAAVAPNGTFAILARSHTGGQSPAPSVTLFSAAGDAVKTLELPNGGILARVAACDSAVAVLDGPSLLFINRETDKSAILLLPTAAGKNSYLIPFFSPDAKELWIFDQSSRRLERYRTPSI